MEIVAHRRRERDARIRATEIATVNARDRTSVDATFAVAVRVYDSTGTVRGGSVVDLTRITPFGWSWGLYLPTAKAGGLSPQTPAQVRMERVQRRSRR